MSICDDYVKFKYSVIGQLKKIYKELIHFALKSLSLWLIPITLYR